MSRDYIRPTPRPILPRLIRAALQGLALALVGFGIGLVLALFFGV